MNESAKFHSKKVNKCVGVGQRPCIRVDMAIQVGGAGEGQLFGLKI